MGCMYTSHRVKWGYSSEDIFVDAILQKSFKHQYDDGSLAPAAFHCPNPSPFQCYHFGIHKAVKCLQFGKTTFRKQASKNHLETISREL